MWSLIILTLLTTHYGESQMAGGDIDSVIEDVFGTPPSPSPPNTETTTSGGAVLNKDDNPVSPNTNLNTGTNTGDPTSCKLKDGSSGLCVSYYLCNKDNNINSNGEGLIDIRFQDDDCKSALEKCCRSPDVLEQPITPAPPKAGEIRNGCGWRNKDGVGMKTTGDINGEAKFGEFPWVVAVLKEGLDVNGSRINVYVCGGSLIHPRVVLTAAHCVHDKTNEVLRIRAGEWDTQTEREIYKHQDSEVERVVVHKDFYKGPLYYDFALLVLREAVPPSPHIGVACLPPSSNGRARSVNCLAAGWGKEKFGKLGHYQVILKKVEVPVVENRVCQSKLQETRLGKFFQLHHTFMCAGGNGQDTCTGDGGAPLACPIEYEEERFEQYGIVAWGIGCGANPAVYADVSQVRDWIDNEVIGAGFDTTSYSY